MPKGLRVKRSVKIESDSQNVELNIDPAIIEEGTDHSAINTYLDLLKKLVLKKPNSVINLLSKEDNEKRTTAHMIARNKEISHNLLLVLDSLADSKPQEVWALLLSQYKGVKLGVSLISEHQRSNIDTLLSLLVKLFSTVNILDDFEIIEEELKLGKDRELFSLGVDWNLLMKNVNRSILRSLFHNPLMDSDINNVLGLLLKAAINDKEKTHFLIKRSQNKLICFDGQVIVNGDAVCHYRYVHLLDLMGDTEALKIYTRVKHNNTAEMITKYVTSEPYNPEKRAMALYALQPGTTLNKIFDLSYSPRERGKCCFPFFHYPQEYNYQLVRFLQRHEEQSIATPQ